MIGGTKKPMRVFSGFPEGKSRLTTIPEAFFSDLLPSIDSLDELKLTLFAMWYLNQQDSDAQYLTDQLFLDHQNLIVTDDIREGEGAEALGRTINKAVSRGTLIKRLVPGLEKDPASVVYLINTANGRRLAKLADEGKWQPGHTKQTSTSASVERPNIFNLYEENIGPLTPMISDMIKATIESFPEEWIADAVAIALKKNARNWRYVEAILTSWRENGRYETNKRTDEEDYRRFIKGEYHDIIEH